MFTLQMCFGERFGKRSPKRSPKIHGTLSQQETIPVSMGQQVQRALVPSVECIGRNISFHCKKRFLVGEKEGDSERKRERKTERKTERTREKDT